APVEREVLALLADGVAVVRVAPADVPDDAPSVGVEQQLVRVEAVAFLRLVRPVHAVAVELTGTCLRKVAVPHEVGTLAQRDALRLALAALVEQAQLHLLRVPREEREVHALAVPGGAERMRRALPQLRVRLREDLRHAQSSRRPVSGMPIQPGRCAIS